MISYYVYLKDYRKNEASLVGVFPERREIPRHQTPAKAGLIWAKKFYRNVCDPQAIYVRLN